MSFKERALKAEEEYEFEKALEYYKKAEDQLSLEDGSLIRFANLLYDFQEFDTAEKVFERIVSEDDSGDILIRLAEIYEENGKMDKALSIYEKLGETNKIKEIKDKENFKKPSSRVTNKMMNLFSGREDTFAIQFSNGYRPVRRALGYKDISDHLLGLKTIGIYQLKKDTTIKFAAYDIDIKKTYLDSDNRYVYEENSKSVARKLKEELDSENIKSYMEFTGNRGYHIWIFFDIPVMSYKVKPVMEDILSRIELEEGIDIEIFPKQTELHGGLGNLIKIPLGVHKKTGEKCLFVDDNFDYMSE